jgi:hypothetical protein
LHDAEYQVGIVSHVQHISSLLSIDEMNDRRMVGIWGVGGIGKTTIAKAIYTSIAHLFEASCFLGNVRETSLVKLQNTILWEIDGQIEKVKSVEEGITLIKKTLCSKRVLFVLDEVDQLVQLDKLAGEVDWFGLGSRIIVTTRDMKVLTDHGVVDDLIYKVKELDYEDALKLFCHKAFKEDKPTEDFLELTKTAIHYSGGLPLALVVLGSYLCGRDIHKWRSALNKFKNIPPREILGKLRISFDELHENEKQIFLDIACFFVGKHEDDIKKLYSDSSLDANHAIDVLKEKSLITIDEHKILAMHNLLRDMGREIVRLESPKDPGKRSRLWFYEDVRLVLEENMVRSYIKRLF